MLVTNKLNEIGLESFLEQYKIKATRHKKFPQLVSLKYSQTDSDMNCPYVKRCRGLIVDELDNWKVISRPYSKFFNYGESRAAEINWGFARVYEKLDGTAVAMYWNPYLDDWDVQTLGTADASGSCGFYDKTFSELFWETFNHLGYEKPKCEVFETKRFTYIFELCTPLNRVVVEHQTPRLVLHGVLFKDCEKELSPGVGWSYIGCEVAKSYKLSNLDDVLALLKTLDGKKQEGFVVVDTLNCNRIKIKHPTYLAVHHNATTKSARHVIEALIFDGDEVASYKDFLESRPFFKNIVEEFKKLKKETVNRYAEISHIDDRKEFAFEANKFKWPAALFKMKFDSCNINQCFEAANIKHLKRLLNCD